MPGVESRAFDSPDQTRTLAIKHEDGTEVEIGPGQTNGEGGVR
jgi:hypothetical protein